MLMVQIYTAKSGSDEEFLILINRFLRAQMRSACRFLNSINSTQYGN